MCESTIMRKKKCKSQLDKIYISYLESQCVCVYQSEKTILWIFFYCKSVECFYGRWRFPIKEVETIFTIKLSMPLIATHCSSRKLWSFRELSALSLSEKNFAYKDIADIERRYSRKTCFPFRISLSQRREDDIADIRNFHGVEWNL